MNRDLRYEYNHASRQREIFDGSVSPTNFPEEVQERHDSKDSFLSMVYAVDPVTNLPTGDLSYMVSDKANPEVKNWILQNLLLDVSAAVMPAAPAGLSDDDIASLARDPKESVQSYMDRVNSYAKSNAELFQRLTAEAKSVSSSDAESPVPSE